MRAPTPARLLQAWERGCDQSVAARALLLLAAAGEDASVDALATLPLGRRDALLLQLHARLFGEDIVGLADCPHCNAEVEAVFDCAGLLALDASGGDPAVQELQVGRTTLRFRLPDSSDLIALETCTEAGDAHATLLARCVLDAAHDGTPCAVDALAEDVAMALAAAMGAADPLSDIRLSFTCPGCANAWDIGLDPARFLWREVQAWSVRMLREVDALARAYHWSESDILAMGARRRQSYLAMCAP